MANAKELMGDGKFDKKRTLAFLADHLPAPLDAEQLLKEAMLRAKTDGKYVFVQETALGCPPCWKLTRFLAAHRRELERDFVWVQLDYRWHGINRVLARLRDSEEHGVPWYAILDAEGKVLISSVDGEGHNIGYPATPKDRGCFRQMRERAATRLTKEEIAALTDALR